MSDAKAALDLKHHHGGISVPELAPAIAWYQDVLGFEVERQFHIPHIPADIAMLKRGDLRIELFQPVNGQEPHADRRTPDLDARTFGNKHVAFAVPDVDAAEAVLRARNVDIVFVKRNAIGANIFLRDNFGNLIELVEQPEMF
jgi:methylmalonyl-CoA/ethylmalonyl-CoA epimerase